MGSARQGRVITAAGLHKSFGNLQVLRHVNFEIPEHHVAAIVGENGAGKSTLLKVLSGFVAADKGSVLLNGKSASSMIGRVGVHPENPNLYPHLSAMDNMRIFSGFVERENLKKMAARLGLDSKVLARKGRHLSFGQRRKALLAAVFCREVDILLLDEPTGGLDPDSTRQVVSLIREQADSGSTIIVTGQDMESLSVIADTLLILSKGMITTMPEWQTRRYDEKMKLTVSWQGELDLPDAIRILPNIRLFRNHDGGWSLFGTHDQLLDMMREITVNHVADVGSISLKPINADDVSKTDR